MEYDEDTLKLRRWMEQERIFEFIDNLHSEPDQVRAQILCLDPFHLYKKCMHVFIAKKVDVRAAFTREFNPKHHSRQLHY